MRKSIWVVWLVISLVLSGCLQSKPSDLAVEVMAKRYWQDTLQLNDALALQQATMLNGRNEGSDVYVAQVRYQLQSQLSESQLIEAIKQAEAQGQSARFDRAEVIETLKNLPVGFQANQSIELVKTLEFRNGSRGWLLSGEIY